MEEIPKSLIEPAQAAESSSQRDFRHGHSRLLNKLLGKKHAPSLGHRDGRRSEMLKEQPAELAFAQAETSRQLFNAGAAAIKRTIIDESQRAGDRVRSSTP